MGGIRPVRAKRSARGLLRASLLVLPLLLPTAGCVPDQGSGAFRDAGAIGTTLTRGVASKADVQKLLGVPNGYGSSLFINVPGGPRDIWYYEDVAVEGMRSERDVLKADVRLQMMLIFFKGDRFDGYLWTTNSAPVAAK